MHVGLLMGSLLWDKVRGIVGRGMEKRTVGCDLQKDSSGGQRNSTSQSLSPHVLPFMLPLVLSASTGQQFELSSQLKQCHFLHSETENK